jgi:hypothetical protein
MILMFVAQKLVQADKTESQQPRLLEGQLETGERQKYGADDVI